ncbi:MAG: patatin-like phospholipase family protein [Casimicrobiaceae bacterium]
MRRPIWLRISSIALAGLPLFGCVFGDEDYREADAPRFVAPTPRSPKPRLALVLGSGGPRGFAHIGALKVLEAEGIKPDLILGASVGAMVGAMYASGHSAAAIEQIALNLNMVSLVDLPALMRGQRMGGASIARFVNNNVDGKSIEQFPIRFAAIAVRASDGVLSIFNHGNAGVAVRASSAIPGRFDPVRIMGTDYIDGDEITPLPIRVARELGAQVVIAINVSEYMEDTPAGVPQEWVTKGWRRARAVETEAPFADVTIHPNTGYYTDVRYEYRVRSIAIAEAATRKMLPQIRAAIARLNSAQPSTACQDCASQASPAG